MDDSRPPSCLGPFALSSPRKYEINRHYQSVLEASRPVQSTVVATVLIPEAGCVSLQLHSGGSGTSPTWASLRVEWRQEESEGCISDFLTLWKDADPDIPILKQAKAEYAKLQ